MEFETNTPINDDQRRLAEAKRLSLEPLDPSLHPDEVSEDYTVAKHLREPAIANVPNDVEQNTAAVQPTPSLVSPTATKKAPSLRSVQAGTIGAVAFLAAVIVAVVLYSLS
jgi:hypothetical protein